MVIDDYCSLFLNMVIHGNKITRYNLLFVLKLVKIIKMCLLI